MSPDREAEIIEAVNLLHALCRPQKAIAKTLDISEAKVRKIIAGGPLPPVQMDLFNQPTADRVSTK